MIENRPWLTIFSHTMLILGIAVILFPLYVAFVAATLDKQAVYAAPMTLIPGTHLLENIHNIWVNGVGTNSAPFWRMLLNSFVMAFSITLGKITVSMLSAFAYCPVRFSALPVPSYLSSCLFRWLWLWLPVFHFLPKGRLS